MNKLDALRGEIQKAGVDAYIQPLNDEFMSEYPPACFRRVQWLCGFSGSAGTAVVTREKAAFFTDGRYTLQAQNEVKGFALHNSGELTPQQWMAEQFLPPQGGGQEGGIVGKSSLLLCPHPGPPPAGEGVVHVGYDPKLYTRDMLLRMQKTLEKKQIALVPVANLVDAVWHNRPAQPESAVFAHDIAYAGLASQDKRDMVAAKLREAAVDAVVLATPDCVCWLLNIRAHDVENTPLALAPAIVDARGAVQLFIAPSRCSAEVCAHLGDGVELCEPSELAARLAALKNKRVLCDSSSVPMWYTQTLAQAGAAIVDGPDPCILPKAMKNAVELKGIRAAHIADAAAVVKLLCWLDGQTQKRSVSEMDVAEKLLAFRRENADFVEPSFPTIAGSGPNGAIVHYHATPESNRGLQPGELFLLDSGGQYPGGTTDITRTVPIGQPNPEHKDRFTRVLKGHIAIATALFPKGTSGSQLDALARQYLWQAGLDYDHGTGHGVGCFFLGVHEGPQRISKRGGDTPLQPGMVVSNEPGYYKTGEYGIRIENLVVVIPPQGGREFLAFDTLTCVPLDTRLVEPAMLTDDEKAWLNAYHAWVQKTLSPALGADERKWLEERCAAIPA